ncbi:hypothetical protein BGZ95_001311 [Linnemannia exigua]|uniref:FAD-binding domain-containing protein n=1 Tax=Linnemannia exigua TaxID=604196 RepID=A0AAD4D722_9FUNG|nr:hypothetical protein BGZ95_001311 [Linnemannia exigua]
MSTTHDFSTSEKADADRPRVLIVGAGLAGLTLGMLLNKADIPFDIYERSTLIKPHGSAMYFNCTTASMFKQCGIYEEFAALGKCVSTVQMCREDRQVDFKMEFGDQEMEFGARGYIIPRPQMHDLLLRQIPEERLHFGSKVVTIETDDNGVSIHCSDGSVVRGDILVGADGAYSAVRRDLYAKLKESNNLPPPDALPLPFTTICVVAQTWPLTPKEFPDLALEECQFRHFVGTNKMNSWSTFTTAQNTVCWSSILFLDEETTKDNATFRNSEWGQETAAEMCDHIKDFPIISGDEKIELTLKDLMDHTPEGQISKVMLEEKVFHTWYSGRTVLIGDANVINGLSSNSYMEDIEYAFKVYKEERLPWVEEAFESSKVHRTMVGQSFASKVTRFVSKHMPVWMFQHIEARSCRYRPQVSFLPLVENTGRSPHAPQPSMLVKTPSKAEKPRTVQSLEK